MVRVFILNGSTTAAEGAGIRNAGDLVLNHTTLSGNTTVGQNGAGISNTGRALVIRSLFAGNATSGPVGNRDGGGIYNNGRDADRRPLENMPCGNGGAFTTAGHTSRVIQSTLSANTAANLGGAIYNEGTTSLRKPGRLQPGHRHHHRRRHHQRRRYGHAPAVGVGRKRKRAPERHPRLHQLTLMYAPRPTLGVRHEEGPRDFVGAQATGSA